MNPINKKAYSDTTVINRDGKEIPVPHDFLCCISLEPMVYPLMTITGQSFEREQILKWIEKNGTNPTTREPLTPSGLIPNRALEARIRFWRENNNVAEEQEPRDANDFLTGKFIGLVDYEKMKMKNGVLATGSSNSMSLNSLATSIVRPAPQDPPATTTTSSRPMNSRRRRNLLLNILSQATAESENEF